MSKKRELAAMSDESQRKPCSLAAVTSPDGRLHYGQGGIVCDGVAYFTGNGFDYHDRGRDKPDDFPFVVAFDAETFRKIRTYPAGDTYDSSPLLLPRRNDSPLLVVREHETAQVLAFERDSGELAWTTGGQTGTLFFGFSYYLSPAGEALILSPTTSGLYALSADDGRVLWHVPGESVGCVTPCVHQAEGWIAYQTQGRLLKIAAASGECLNKVDVPAPNQTISWATVLIDDCSPPLLATYWIGGAEWDSAIRVYDSELRLRWERVGLAMSKKNTLCYYHGQVSGGCGNPWSKAYQDPSYRRLYSWDIETGAECWCCDLSTYDFKAISNVVYVDGYLLAHTEDVERDSKIFRIDSRNGEVVELFEYDQPTSSCASFIVADGKIFEGDLVADRIHVTRFADAARFDWPGPFGDPQRHHMAASARALDWTAMHQL